MAADKNFKINREAEPLQVEISELKIGDVFERQGSLHIRVNICIHHDIPDGKEICVCNLNTGSVWYIKPDDKVSKVNNCEINYEVVK